MFAPARPHPATKPAVSRQPARKPVPVPHQVPALPLQRKAACACGGACPRCKAKAAGLTIGPTDDVHEREADQVAHRVMRMEPAGGNIRPAAASVQRKCERCGVEIDEDDAKVRRKPAESALNTPAAAPASVAEVLQSAGQALDGRTRAFFEPRFGWDFAMVRVHADAAANRSAQEVNARAYTLGRDIVFGGGQYAPATTAGQHLLAHELTHVVQQSAAGGAGMARRNILQRQQGEMEGESDDDIDVGQVDPSTTLTTPPPEFGERTSEPPCPPVPTGLGNLQPDPPCPSSAESIAGMHFQFCLDSDVFKDQAQSDNLRSFARSQRADSIFKVHGYASTVGKAGYNLNLSCHRAKRAARELQNAGVPSQQIELAAQGETSDFGPNPADNQTVLVGAYAPAGQVTPSGPAPATPRAIVDRAAARIAARDYRLGADAYLSRWTCGRMPSAAEMVARLTIKIQGEAPNDVKPNRMGQAVPKGLREIWLGSGVFTESSDPVLCAMARILDLGFHHFVHDSLNVPVGNTGVLHDAALFFVEQAGIPPCETPGTPNPLDPTQMVDPARPWWNRPAVDPLANLPTGCPDQPLPGPIDPQHQPSHPAVPLTFAIADSRTESGAAPIEAQVDPDQNVVRIASPRGAFRLDATVQASGDAAQFPRYQVGYLQTIVADETVVTYVSGDAVHLAVPTPIRDGPPRGLAPPPWFMPPTVATLDSSGRATIGLSDSPAASMAFTLVDFSRRGRVPPGTDLRQQGNDLAQATVRTTFNTWVAARRDDAPLDRFSTHFIRGHQVTFSMDLGMIGTRAKASYASDIDPTPLADASPMQLAGPTPAEIPPSWRLVRVTPPVPRGSVANAADLEEIRRRVREAADELEPLRIALHLDGPLMIRVRFDRNSGRLILDTPARHATTVEETGPADERVGVGEGGREQLGREFTIRLRPDLVAAPSVPDISAGIPTALRALPSFSRRRASQGDANPFAPSHGIGLLARIREEQELARSAEQLRTNPGDYDPAFWPDVQVNMERERYCYNFTVSGVNIDQVCVDPTMRTEGCVRLFSRNEFTFRATPQFASQQLGGVTFQSPVALSIKTFPVGFVMFTPSESPGGDTFNHEMHHMIDCFNQVQALKDRLARRIRARLMDLRRLAAAHPELRDSLLSRQAIFEIALQENAAFMRFFQTEFLARGEALHAREARGHLPPYKNSLPGDWTTFHEPKLIGGTKGSFDDKPC